MFLNSTSLSQGEGLGGRKIWMIFVKVLPCPLSQILYSVFSLLREKVPASWAGDRGWEKGLGIEVYAVYIHK